MIKRLLILPKTLEYDAKIVNKQPNFNVYSCENEGENKGENEGENKGENEGERTLIICVKTKEKTKSISLSRINNLNIKTVNYEVFISENFSDSDFDKLIYLYLLFDRGTIKSNYHFYYKIIINALTEILKESKDSQTNFDDKIWIDFFKWLHELEPSLLYSYFLIRYISQKYKNESDIDLINTNYKKPALYFTPYFFRKNPKLEHIIVSSYKKIVPDILRGLRNTNEILKDVFKVLALLPFEELNIKSQSRSKCNLFLKGRIGESSHVSPLILSSFYNLIKDDSTSGRLNNEVKFDDNFDDNGQNFHRITPNEDEQLLYYALPKTVSIENSQNFYNIFNKFKFVNAPLFFVGNDHLNIQFRKIRDEFNLSSKSEENIRTLIRSGSSYEDFLHFKKSHLFQNLFKKYLSPEMRIPLYANDESYKYHVFEFFESIFDVKKFNQIFKEPLSISKFIQLFKIECKPEEKENHIKLNEQLQNKVDSVDNFKPKNEIALSTGSLDIGSVEKKSIKTKKQKKPSLKNRMCKRSSNSSENDDSPLSPRQDKQKINSSRNDDDEEEEEEETPQKKTFKDKKSSEKRRKHKKYRKAKKEIEEEKQGRRKERSVSFDSSHQSDGGEEDEENEKSMINEEKIRRSSTNSKNYRKLEDETFNFINKLESPYLFIDCVSSFINSKFRMFDTSFKLFSDEKKVFDVSYLKKQLLEDKERADIEFMHAKAASINNKKNCVKTASEMNKTSNIDDKKSNDNNNNKKSNDNDNSKNSLKKLNNTITNSKNNGIKKVEVVEEVVVEEEIYYEEEEEEEEGFLEGEERVKDKDKGKKAAVEKDKGKKAVVEDDSSDNGTDNNNNNDNGTDNNNDDDADNDTDNNAFINRLNELHLESIIKMALLGILNQKLSISNDLNLTLNLLPLTHVLFLFIFYKIEYIKRKDNQSQIEKVFKCICHMPEKEVEILSRLYYLAERHSDIIKKSPGLFNDITLDKFMKLIS